MTSPRRLSPGTVVLISIAWGLLPLASYLPGKLIPPVLDHAFFVLCFPGWMLALFFTGGVHGEFWDAAPLLCAAFTAVISFVAISWVIRIWPRKER